MWFAICYMLSIFVSSSYEEQFCINPNRKWGTCILLSDCASLNTTVLKPELTDGEKRFLVDSRCDANRNEPFVCCTADTNYIPKRTPRLNNVAGIPEYPPGEVLPDSLRCGRPYSRMRIMGGVPSKLYQFPWMALLEYTHPNGRKTFGCGGTLISKRYVITAAHCFSPMSNRQLGKLSIIRLGEFDINEEIDCQRSRCADPVLEVGFDEVIPHPDFVKSGEDGIVADIAMIRLDQDVPFTKTIRPICLPSLLGRSDPPTGNQLTIAGWGKTEEVFQSNVLQYLHVAVFDHDECKVKFNTIHKEVHGHIICAGGVEGEDSCNGDSGGPLMSCNYTSTICSLEGVISAGFRCAHAGWPALYTKISSFEPWIKGNMKA